MPDTRSRHVPRSRLHILPMLLAGVLALTTLSAASTAASAFSARTSNHAQTKPTVVLVHGAWADSASWSGVAITGPIVLVGHSYGGAIVTDAATGNANVKALVYLDAFAPDEGENVLQLAGATSALANPDPTKVFSFVPNTLPPTAGTDLYVLQSLFPSTFANDLPAREGAVLAATQRPVTFGALNEVSTTPAWKTIPSWYEIGTIDKVIPPSQQLTMAQRAGAHITMIKTSHLPMISQPKAVENLIETAAAATI